MTKTIQNNLYFIEEYRKIISSAMLSAVLMTVIAYVFLLGSAYLGGIERQQLSREAESLRSEVATLEGQYLSLKNGINEDFAKSKGFVSVKDSNLRYLSVQPVSSGLSVNKNY